jgi:heme/copper-type cytochrome/quinol oxidase subunit 2
MDAFWICVAIAVAVFGAMIYSLVKFRKSQEAILDATMLHSTKVDVIWTIIPVLILVVVTIPAAQAIRWRTCATTSPCGSPAISESGSTSTWMRPTASISSPRSSKTQTSRGS